jgi:hypothetical protein
LLGCMMAETHVLFSKLLFVHRIVT